MKAIDNLNTWMWPAAHLDDAIRTLAHKSGLVASAEMFHPQATIKHEEVQSLDRSIDAVAHWLGIEAESVSTAYTEVDQLLQRGGPALLRIYGSRQTDEAEPHFIALLKGGRHFVSIVGADLAVHRVARADVRAALCYPLEQPLLSEIDHLLDQIELPPNRRPPARAALLRERLRHAEVKECWVLRLSPGASLWTQMWNARLPHYLAIAIACESLQYLLYLGAWGLIGLGAVQGRFGWAWFIAGLLMWYSGCPFVITRIWTEKLFATGLGNLLKQRLYFGVLRLDLDEVQQQGTGRFLAWVMESERLEEATLGGGLLVLHSTISLLTLSISLMVAGGYIVALLLLLWLVFTVFIASRLLQSYLAVQAHYSEMTNELLEQIMGHQTRLVQENDWYTEADKALSHYQILAQKYSRNSALLFSLIPEGWGIIGLLGTAVAFLLHPNDYVAVGISFLALMLGHQQLEILVWGLSDVVRAFAAWRLIAPIQQAAGKHTPVHTESVEYTPPIANQLILDTRNLVFRYTARSRAILNGVDLKIHAGDRMLLEGPSGGGKSTLASLLIGLYQSESGLLLLRGLDRQTTGDDTWRKWIVAAPQFHENHILNSSFAFNLLMGRRWPPSPADLDEAEEICRELGLGHLLQQMPNGLHQMIGSDGWRLSQGERSRVYMARALLQKADIVILDESFASLDPENMQIALQCALNRSPTLLVIAHP